VLRRRFREETITDLMMGGLLGMGTGVIIVEFPDEPTTGADMQWDFVGRAAGTFFRVFVQAKQLYGSGEQWTRHSYKELLRKSGGVLQAKTLCNMARSNSFTYPLYIFYNPEHSCLLANAKRPDNLLGVNLADGFRIEALVLSATDRKSRIRNLSLKAIQPHLYSLADLFCPPSFMSVPPMAFARSSGLGPFFNLPRGASHILGVSQPPRPEDICERLLRARRVIDDDANQVWNPPSVSHEIPADVLQRIGMRSSGEKGSTHGLDKWRVTFISNSETEVGQNQLMGGHQ
jgi:hypothetical protein